MIKKNGIEVILKLPPTLNHTYRFGNGRMWKTQEAKAWQEEVEWMCKKEKPLKGLILLEINMFLLRDRDIDSSLKLVLDAFQAVGIYKNDSQITQLVVKKEIDKSNPRMEAVLTEI